MTRIGRNERCPCGSGKKYKSCCLRRGGANAVLSDGRVTRKLGISLSAPHDQLLGRAIGLYHSGFLLDCIDICEELDRTGSATVRSREYHFLAYAALAGNPQNSIYECEAIDRSGAPNIKLTIGKEGIEHQFKVLQFARPHTPHSIESLYPVESLYMRLLESPEITEETRGEICILRTSLQKNLWIVPSALPTTTLSLARLLMDTEIDLQLAKELICCSIGWRYCYQRIEDLLTLATLLNHFKVPRVFWTNLLSLYFDFTASDDLNKEIFLKSDVNEVLVTLHGNEINWLEGVFHQYCASHGLPERDEISDLFLQAINETPAEDTNDFPGVAGYEPGPYDFWLSAECFQMRHPWFSLLEQKERDFLRNADTAFCACLTEDYSFACSQWWRCLESVLKRILIKPIGELIDANPGWLEQDSRTPRVMKKEELFTEHLTHPTTREKLTLAPMLILIETAMKDIRLGRTSESIIRTQVVQHMTTQLSEFIWISRKLDAWADFRSSLIPNVFTEHTIRAFRNASSHDQPMTFAEAAVGRLLAIRILDHIHYPRYCVEERLLELKTELGITGNWKQS
jgi:hypothetical protein